MLIGRVQYQAGFLTVCRVALFFQTYVSSYYIIYRFNGFGFIILAPCRVYNGPNPQPYDPAGGSATYTYSYTANLKQASRCNHN